MAPYINRYGSLEQKQKFLPKMISGEAIGAIAMTEPGAGSDLQGVRTMAVAKGEDYIINGSKTYITNGAHADLVLQQYPSIKCLSRCDALTPLARR